MLINHRTLAPLHCASTDETRYNLNGLHFTADGQTVGTDGHIMAYVTPKLDGDPVKLEPFTLEYGALVALQKEQRKKRAIPASLVVDVTNANGHARIEGTSIGAIEPVKIIGDYPAWQQVVPKREADDHVVGLSASVLECMLNTVRQFTETSRGKAVNITFRFPKDNLKPISADVADLDSGDELHVVLMPMRPHRPMRVK